MRAWLFGALAASLLVGCDIQIGDGDGKTAADGVKVSVAKNENGGDRDRVSLKLPGFDASISMADLNLGEHVSFDDGIGLATDTRVSGINVDANGAEDRDLVTVSFTNPRPPAAVAEHYRSALIEAGYVLAASSPSEVRGAKGRKSFAVTLTPDGAGTRGQISMTKN